MFFTPITLTVTDMFFFFKIRLLNCQSKKSLGSGMSCADTCFGRVPFCNWLKGIICVNPTLMSSW